MTVTFFSFFFGGGESSLDCVFLGGGAGRGLIIRSRKPLPITYTVEYPLGWNWAPYQRCRIRRQPDAFCLGVSIFSVILSFAARSTALHRRECIVNRQPRSQGFFLTTALILKRNEVA